MKHAHTTPPTSLPPPPPPRKSRLSPFVYVLFVFILFVAVLYSEDFACAFDRVPSQPTPFSRPSSRKGEDDVKVKVEDLPFAIGRTDEGCDLFCGRWVRDEGRRTIYEESECPYIQRS